MGIVKVLNKAGSWICLESLVRNIPPEGSFVMDLDDAKKNPDIRKCLGMGILALEEIKLEVEKPMIPTPSEEKGVISDDEGKTTVIKPYKQDDTGLPDFVEEKSIAPQKTEKTSSRKSAARRSKPVHEEVAVVATDMGKTQKMKMGNITEAPLPAFIDDVSVAPQDEEEEGYSKAFVDREDTKAREELDEEKGTVFIESDLEESANNQVVIKE